MAKLEKHCLEVLCTLEADERAVRGDEWRKIVGTGERSAIPGGVRLRFRPDAATTHQLVDLVTGERDCCGWASWTLTAAADATVVEVTAPGDGAGALQALFEVAA
jgi:urease beta subunit